MRDAGNLWSEIKDELCEREERAWQPFPISGIIISILSRGSRERSINYSYHSDNANTSQNNNYTHNIPGDLCCKYGDFHRTPIHNWQFVRRKFLLVLELWCGQSNENVNVWILWCSALPSSGMTRLSAIIPVTPGRWWYLCKHSPRVSYFRVYTNCPGNGGGDTLTGCQVFKWR